MNPEGKDGSSGTSAPSAPSAPSWEDGSSGIMGRHLVYIESALSVVLEPLCSTQIDTQYYLLGIGNCYL